jgi:hypothetical protein
MSDLDPQATGSTVMRITIADTPISVSGSVLRVAGIHEKDEHFYDIRDPRAMIEELKARRIRADLFTFWQRLPDTDPKFPYYFEWDNIAAIPLTTYDDWLKNQVSKNTRKAVRKSFRQGIEVKRAPFDRALVEGIAEIFNETPVRQGRRFTNFGRTIDDVDREWSQDLERSEFLTASFGSELVGFVKLLSAGAYVRMSGTLCKLAHRDKAPMNALIAEAVRCSISQGFKHLVYGKFTYGNKGTDSLTDFKRHNGFERIEIPRYFIPITHGGRLALSLGLHHGLRTRLPQSVLRLLLQTRSEWYRRRFRLKAPEC